MNKEPFDLVRAIKGEPVVTRDGSFATFTGIHSDRGVKFPVQFKTQYGPIHVRLNGSCPIDGLDLFMAAPEQPAEPEPFDLARAQAGEIAITRGSDEVTWKKPREAVYIGEGATVDGFDLCFLVNGSFHGYGSDGSFSNTEHYLDLVSMKPANAQGQQGAIMNKDHYAPQRSDAWNGLHAQSKDGFFLIRLDGDEWAVNHIGGIARSPDGAFCQLISTTRMNDDLDFPWPLQRQKVVAFKVLANGYWSE